MCLVMHRHSCILHGNPGEAFGSEVFPALGYGDWVKLTSPKLWCATSVISKFNFAAPNKQLWFLLVIFRPSSRL